MHTSENRELIKANPMHTSENRELIKVNRLKQNERYNITVQYISKKKIIIIRNTCN